MSDLPRLLAEAKGDRPPWEPIPEAAWPAIAARCGTAEIEELEARITALRAELKTVPDWDGDTSDDVHRALYFFGRLLELAGP